MEVLLTGNTEYVSPSWIEAAFPEDHVLTTRFSGAGSVAGVRAITLDRPSLIGELMETYEFERIVYFSEYLTPHTEREGELDWLRRVLQAVREKPVQMLYITGPECVMVPTTGKSVLARAAELLCRQYASGGKLQIKVLHLPYLYSVDTAAGQKRLFEKAATGHLHLDEQAQSLVYAICTDDVAELVLRIFDSWTPDWETFTAPVAVSMTYRELTEKVNEFFPGVQIEYGQDEPKSYPKDKGVLRRRFGWFPHYDLAHDLPEIFALWQKGYHPPKNFLERIWQKLAGQKKALEIVEILAAWAVTEVLVRLTGTEAQFRMVDFRLAFIVLSGTMYGLNAGVLAAFLGAISLILGYLRQGTTPILLFYEPSNWLAFIVYFLVGAVCGYVKLHGEESMQFVQDENDQARERLEFVQRLYHDTLEDKRLFRRQILGRKDSFGKIYSVTQQLNEIEPQKLYHKTMRVMEDVLQNQSLCLYQVDPNQRFARQVAASPAIAQQLPRSLEMKNYRKLLEAIEQEGIWVNRTFEQGMPSYACAVRDHGCAEVLVFLQKAREDQLSLYYQNLFRILCGLVENSLVRAFEYENTAKAKKMLPGTRVLRKESFLEKLSAVCSMQEDKVAQHLLVRVLKPAGQQLYDLLGSTVRASDFVGIAPDGTVCILMIQAKETELPIVRSRLAQHGIEIETVAFEQQLDWLAEEKEKVQ